MEEKLLEIQEVTDIEKAEELFRTFSPNETIYDIWEFRFCFYKYFSYPISFRVGYIQGQPTGLLPLQFNTDKGYFEFFGGSYMGNNRVFIVPGYEKYISNFYNSVEGKVKLEWMIGDDTFTQKLEIQDFDYFLNLENFQTFDNYLETFALDEVKRKWRKINTQNKIEVITNQFDDLELLFEWNIKKFNDDSSFLMPFRQESFKDVLKIDVIKPYIFTFSIDGIKQAVSFGLVYNNIYVSVNQGISDTCTIRDMSTYVLLYHIKAALEEKNRYINVLTSDCGWKERWKFSKTPQFQFLKNLN